MNTLTPRLLIAATTAAITLSAGSAAYADDTEILSTSTIAARENRPNTLFIADTSGSMGAQITTEEVYDPGQTYTGACDDSRYYFATDGTSPPACAGNDNWFDKSLLVCQQGLNSLNGGGRYSDVLAQYYSASAGAAKWDSLSQMNTNWIIECARDDGEHGNGSSASEVYAKRGSTGQPFTAVEDDAVFWGAQPTEVTYFLYDGNYLNYSENPPVSQQTRISVLRDVLDSFYNTLQDTNAGLMRFNGGDGGRVIQAIEDLDSGTHRADLISSANGLPAGGVTPLSETLYESVQYWTGRERKFPSAGGTDSEALDASGNNYIAPTSFECTNNYQILLSDGAPVWDFDTPDLVDSMPGFATLTGNGVADCTGNEASAGACMDDMAAYLAPPEPDDQDLIDAKRALGVPDVSTYTIGFQLTNAGAITRMQETAARGKGQYFDANSLVDLIAALETIQDLEAAGETTFTSPSVSVNSFNRTRTLDDLYFTVFEASTQAHWPGNLKRYKLDDGVIVDADGADAVGSDGLFVEGTRSFWTPNGIANPNGTTGDGGFVAIGGAASNLPPVAARKVYTNFDNGAELNSLNLIETATLSAADLGISGLADDPTVAQLVDWIRGSDEADVDNDPATALRLQIGDPLHSQPASIIYGGTAADPEGLIIFGTNDGYVHAIDMETGVEAWSFLPYEFLDNQNTLFKNQALRYKNYGVDGNMVPIIFDENQDGNIDGDDFIYLAFGMRRGGGSYYLLDITSKTAPPTLKWRLDDTDLDGLGWTWAAPVPARIKANSAVGQDPDSKQIALVIGGGYDATHDVIDHPSSDDGEGARIFMVDLETGDPMWAAANANVSGVTTTVVNRSDGEAEMNRAIPASPTVLDVSGDGYDDRIYVGDMGGQILRFDITNEVGPSTFGVTGGVIAQLGAQGNGGTGAPEEDVRRFYNSPDVALIRDDETGIRSLAILIGSGYRASPLSVSVSDRFYSVRDKDIFTTLSQTQYDNYDIVDESDLVTVDRTSNAGVSVPSGKDGWKLELDTGEKILARSGTFLGTTFFSSFTPNNSSTNPCVVAGGLNRLYRVDPADAAPTFIDASAPADEDQRFIDLSQSGIVADPVFLFGDKDDVIEIIPPRPDGCPPELSDKECVCLDDPSNSICGVESCEDDPSTASAVVCLANYCTSLPACLRPVRTIWTQEGAE